MYGSVKSLLFLLIKANKEYDLGINLSMWGVKVNLLSNVIPRSSNSSKVLRVWPFISKEIRYGFLDL